VELNTSFRLGTNVRDIAQSLSSLVVALTVICFSIGFLVINLRLGRYGVYSTDLIRSEYVTTGLLFVILVVITHLSYSAGLSSAKFVIQRWKEGKRIESIFGVTFVAMEFFAPMSVALMVLSGFKPFLGLPNSWTVLGALIISTFFMSILIEHVVELLKDIQEPLSVESSRERFISKIKKTPFLLIISLWGFWYYANFAYPYLSSTLGGGEKGSVILLATTQGLAASKSFKLPIQEGTQLIGPLQFLTETDSEIVVIIESGVEKEFHALRLQRNMFEAILTATIKKPTNG
jgi:hypothetical protein